MHVEYLDTARSETQPAEPINWGLLLVFFGCLCFWGAVGLVVFAAVR
jgi:hypothetical protein